MNPHPILQKVFGLRALPMIGGLLAALLVGSLFVSGPHRDLKERKPGADNADLGAVAYAGPPQLKGLLEKADGTPSELPGAWPRFRGKDFDGVDNAQTPLAKRWGGEGPRALWTVTLGEGYAGAAVLNGRVYVLDYDRDKHADVVRCFSSRDGKDIWRYSYPVKVKRNHGMSRTVPSVTDKYLVTLGPKCHVTCLDASTGKLLWPLDLVHEFRATIPQWYAGQCPLVEGERVILAPAGDALMIAVDCRTGKVLWKTPNPHHWKMSHSSIIPMSFKGQSMYVYCAQGGVAGVSATDGRLLWETEAWKISIATVPSPVIIDKDRIFLSGGYNSGCMMLQMKESGKAFTVEPVFKLKPDVFGATQQTPIYYKGYLYGVRPDGQMVCLDLTGKVVWSSGSEHRFGLGPFMIAKGLLYVMNDTGVLTLLEASPAGYKQLSQAKVLEGPDAWAPMALAGGRLIIRDLTKMVCLDVKG
ncbi:MAG: PQQ-like beta-propeller repeat protein [Armatimonadetes bacterium]|nr:PQQ-like beta-propeller repeat protein [Armatimonadota bacterium]